MSDPFLVRAVRSHPFQKPQAAIQKRTQKDFVCDLPAFIDGGPIRGERCVLPQSIHLLARRPSRKGFAMLLRQDIIIIAISALVGIALAYVVHGLP